jgi:hypothetical protein
MSDIEYEEPMKVLVAPSKSEYDSVKQSIDFYHAVEGEYLVLGFTCDCWRHPHSVIRRGESYRIVTSCGCDRAFTGLSGSAATVGKVTTMSRHEFNHKFYPEFENSKLYEGWKSLMSLEELIVASFQPIVHILEDDFEVGDLLMIETTGEESVEVFKAMSETQYSDKYMKSGGSLCPVCDSSEIVSGFDSLGWEADYIASPVACNDCGSTWEDIFTLSGLATLDVRPKSLR